MNKDTYDMIERLKLLGISEDDAFALRRISMTLHRWHELECGDGTGCIERDEHTGRTYWRRTAWYAGAGNSPRVPTPDREKGAHKRLAAIMARYPKLSSYVQTDPRGAALYILRPSDVPKGSSVDSCYSNGVAVYK